MRNLWIFLNRYNAFFFFIIFSLVGLVLTVRNNSYPNSIILNSTNQLVGSTYQQLNVAKRYLNMGQVNDSLVHENALLKTQLIALNNVDTAKDSLVSDSINAQRYRLLAARVIKNSVTQTNNIITINKGAKNGIAKDDAVMAPNKGIIGFVKDISANYATIRSLLNSETAISVNLKKNNAYGSLVWGEANYDYRKAYVKEIPNHFKVKIGDTIITSGAGGFPKGIEVGRVSKTQVATGDSFMTLEITLFNDFSSLPYVYVVKDRAAQEIKTLENPPVTKNER